MDFDHPPADPLQFFDAWFKDAKQTRLPNPNAMTLATVDPDRRPSARIVLLKDIDEAGAVFYSNKNSRKGRAIEAHPEAALLFHWDELGRQVRIEGHVADVSDAEADRYFASRPRMSQIGAWASRQSEPVASREELDAAVAAIERRFDGQPVPRPKHWGGYRVSLEQMEFWQAHEFRLHDRLLYTRQSGGAWSAQRLYP